VQEEFDTYDDNAHLFVKLQFLKRRSKIIEIVAAKDIIFALANSGLCAAFNRGRLCSMDTDTRIGIGWIRIRGYGNFLENIFLLNK
jgi:hypothetical protein